MKFNNEKVRNLNSLKQVKDSTCWGRKSAYWPKTWPLCCFMAPFMNRDKAGDVTGLQHSAREVVWRCLQPEMSLEASAAMFQNKSEAWLRWVVHEDQSEKREKFVLGPPQGRSVTNWGEGDEWGHSLGLMKEFLLSTEWGWAHLHLIGGHKPVTSKIAQEALWDSRPSNKPGCTRLPGASIGAWQLLQRRKNPLSFLWSRSQLRDAARQNKNDLFFFFFPMRGLFDTCPWCQWRMGAVWFHATSIFCWWEMSGIRTRRQILVRRPRQTACRPDSSSGRMSEGQRLNRRCRGAFSWLIFFKELSVICCRDLACIIQFGFKTAPTTGNGCARFFKTPPGTGH